MSDKEKVKEMAATKKVAAERSTAAVGVVIGVANVGSGENAFQVLSVRADREGCGLLHAVGTAKLGARVRVVAEVL